MEVPHTQHHPNKPFKEYLYEFFMLFIAVTAGFYADNLREKSVEKHKEHEYMESMVADLKQDLEHMDIAIVQLKSAAAGIDTLARMCYQKTFNDSEQFMLYDLNLRHLKLIPLTFSDRTSSQLKNSGSLRLIKNKAVTDSLLNYWQQIDYFNNVSPLNENFRREARELSFEFFDLGNYDIDFGFTTKSLRVKNPHVISTDKTLLQRYANHLWAYKSTLKYYYNPPVEKLKRQAQNLIALIKKEYTIE